MRGNILLTCIAALLLPSCTSGFDPFGVPHSERQYRMFVSLNSPDIRAECAGRAAPLARDWNTHWQNVIHAMRHAENDPLSPYQADAQRCIRYVVDQRRSAALPELWPTQ